MRQLRWRWDGQRVLSGNARELSDCEHNGQPEVHHASRAATRTQGSLRVSCWHASRDTLV
eukprot:4785590-Prymnesium_polylepis.2